MRRLARVALVGVAGPSALLVSVLVVLTLTGVAKAYRIPSAGMEPTLRCPSPAVGCSGAGSDRILVLKYVVGDPGRADVIVLHTPPEAAAACGEAGTRVKRVIGLPGERWEERSGFVYVDGRRLRETYVDADRRDTRTIAPRRIPHDAYVVLGDNRSASCDSRDWGFLPRKDVVGKVVAVYWPPKRISFR